MENIICLDLIQRKIKARREELERIHFHNINPLKIGSLNHIINLIRDLPNTNVLIVENCVLNEDNIDAIGFYIKWKCESWKEIRLINCGLN
jgi:hypothetical protein